VPFTFYLNLDKTVVGLIILGITLTLTKTITEWKILWKKVLCCLPIGMLIILVLSFILRYVWKPWGQVSTTDNQIKTRLSLIP
jgi:hypothetical protein